MLAKVVDGFPHLLLRRSPKNLRRLPGGTLLVLEEHHPASPDPIVRSTYGEMDLDRSALVVERGELEDNRFARISGQRAERWCGHRRPSRARSPGWRRSKPGRSGPAVVCAKIIGTVTYTILVGQSGPRRDQSGEPILGWAGAASETLPACARAPHCRGSCLCSIVEGPDTRLKLARGFEVYARGMRQRHSTECAVSLPHGCPSPVGKTQQAGRAATDWHCHASPINGDT